MNPIIYITTIASNIKGTIIGENAIIIPLFNYYTRNLTN